MSLTKNSAEVRSFVKYIALLLLFLNGIGAFVGGIPMILYPDGSANGISLSFLQHSPFTDYFFPGLILVLCNGVLSFLVALALLVNVRHHSWFVMGQGIVLLSWIVIEMLMIREVHFLHVSFACIGAALIVLGSYMSRFEFK